jgi:hypothetical protein
VPGRRIRPQRLLRVDAVDKVGGMPPARNNRIMGDDFLNRSCAFVGCLESILLGDHPQNHFSTVSVKTGNARREQIESALRPEADIARHGSQVRIGP